MTLISGRNQNPFAAAAARAMKAADGCAVCELCTGDSHTMPLADNWCHECRRALCCDCVVVHLGRNGSHRVSHLIDALQALVESGVDVQLCDIHGGICNILCTQCKIIQCSTCVKKCLDKKHSIQAVDSDQTSHLVKSCVQELRELLSCLGSRPLNAAVYDNLAGRLREARMAHMKILQSNKKALLDSVDRAYKTAEGLLGQYYESFESKTADAAGATRLLERKVQQAKAYGTHLLSSGNLGTLLQQHQILLSRMRSLMEEVSRLPAVLEPSACIALESALAGNVEEMCQEWIGIPKLLSTDPDHEQMNDPLQQQEEWLKNIELALGTASSSFTVAVKCWDLAVTEDGHLLLATGEHGLKEYNASGNELSSWSPAAKASWRGQEYLYTVDALQDRRVAVGLYRACAVQLLRRCHTGDDQWLVDQSITCFQGGVWRLSVHAQLLAVAEMWEPRSAGGNEFRLVCLPCGRELLRKKLSRFAITYGIQSAIVTDQAVITAGQDMLKVGLFSKQQSMLDCFSHQGKRLWGLSLDEVVSDICAAPSGRVIYLALRDSKMVRAVSTNDGSQLIDVLSGRLELTRPLRLSMSRGQMPVMAVLNGDETVIVYPVSISSSSSR